MDYKKRVRNAVEGFYKRQEEQDLGPQRKNEKPEEEVVNSCLIWLKQNDFDVDCIESKSKFNTSTMRYTGRAASSGTSDICGNYRNGLATYVECKSIGRRSTLRDGQRAFLIRKIQTNCFGAVVDSVELLEKTWNHFKSIPPQERIKFLLDQLPKKRDKEQTSLFDE